MAARLEKIVDKKVKETKHMTGIVSREQVMKEVFENKNE